MVLNIRNEEADLLARRLAEIDRSSITDAVVTALREAIRSRRRTETTVQSARAVLRRHGVAAPAQIGRPVDQNVWDDLHDDPTERT